MATPYVPSVVRLAELRKWAQNPSERIIKCRTLVQQTRGLGGNPLTGSSVFVQAAYIDKSVIYAVCDQDGFISAAPYTHYTGYALELDIYFPGIVRVFCTAAMPYEQPLVQRAVAAREARDNAIRESSRQAAEAIGLERQQSRAASRPDPQKAAAARALFSAFPSAKK